MSFQKSTLVAMVHIFKYREKKRDSAFLSHPSVSAFSPTGHLQGDLPALSLLVYFVMWLRKQ